MTILSIINHPDFGQVRNVVLNNEPWFVAKDICDVLGLTNSRKATSKIDDEEKGVTITDTPGGEQKLTIVNESGLYSLIFQSRKPTAKVFKKWVTSEVLPSIRKYGYYVVPTNPASRKERNAIERAYYKELGKNITDEDIYKVAKRMRQSASYVEAVLKGGIKDNNIMRLLQDRALANKDMWFDGYTTTRMDEIVSRLK